MPKGLQPASGVVLLVALLGTLTSVHAGAAARDEDYTRLVTTYRGADIVAAVGEIARWPEERVKAARRDAKTSPEHMARALAMLHTEAAFALLPDRRADTHLSAAEAFVDALPGRDVEGFVARWRVLAATYDVMPGRMPGAQVRVRRARGMGTHNRHAELMLVALQEIELRRRVGGRVRDEGTELVTVPSVGGSGLSGVEKGTALAPAYGRVVEMYPDFLAARLRWGWALFVNRSPNARAQLEQVAARATRPDLRYLAQLFLGAVAEREHRLDDARRAYEAAIAAVPQQSALIGLIAVARALGDQPRLVQAVRTLQGLTAANGEDPWIYYNRGFTGDELLSELRAEAQRP